MSFNVRLTRRLTGGLAVLALAGASWMLLSYAHWVYGIEEGSRLLDRQDFPAARTSFALSESQFEHSLLRPILPRAQYRVLLFNRVRLLMEMKQDGEIAPLLEAAAKRQPWVGDDSEYHFWMGNLQYRKALALSDKQARRAGLQQAAGSFRLVLNSDPGDWDAKFNFQNAMRLLNGMRDKKEDTTEKMKQGGMKILREDTDKAKEQQQKLSPEKRG
ncbi:MAG: hypothetical protein JWO80_1017 [Bryobacterales bacterium]|nr:hypothetical protein [Bryobacterales bacterium]